MRVVCLFVNQNTDLQTLAESCFQYSPQVALLPGQAVFLEISGTQKLYDETTLRSQLRDMLEVLNLRAQIVFGYSIPETLARAMYQKNHVGDLPIEALSIYHDPFGLKVDDAFTKQMKTFHHLGLHTLGALLTLVPNALGTRFGKDVVMAQMALDGAANTPWPAFVPRKTIIESQLISEDDRLQSLEPLLFLLKGLLERTFLRLKGKGHVPTSLELRIHQEPYSFVRMPLRVSTLKLPFPARTAAELLSFFRDKLSAEFQKIPLDSPVVQLELEIKESVASRAGQFSFFSKIEEARESFEKIVNLLRERLGNTSVFLTEPTGSYTPERSWSKTLDSKEHDTFTLPKRPLQLFKKPYVLRRNKEKDLDILWSKRRRWTIRQMNGPERLAGEWWLKETQARDYFHVVTHEGQDLWVFQTPGTDAYYLHGVFD